MRTDSVRFFVAALALVAGLAAQPLHFMGRPVTVAAAEQDPDGYPNGPASICLEGAPQRQCYTAPEDFGLAPKVEVVQIDKVTSAILFSAVSGGVSQSMIHFALLRPSSGPELEDLFTSNASVTNQSQHRFINDAKTSKASIFVTADYIFGMYESRTGLHRFILSTYRYRYSGELERSAYWLEDRFMTVRRYDIDANADVITSEKSEILRRLALVKAVK